MTVQNDVLAVVDKLSETELKYCRALVGRHFHGKSKRDVWREVNNDYSSTDHTVSMACWRFEQREGVKEYLATLVSEHREDAVMSVNELQQRLTRWSRDVEDVLQGLPTEYLERRNEETGETLGFEKVYAVEGPWEIQPTMEPYVRELVWESALGKFRVVIDEKYAQKEKLKAAELLGKTQGAFVERQELSGPGGTPLTTHAIPSDMSATDAADIYRKALNGESE